MSGKSLKPISPIIADTDDGEGQVLLIPHRFVRQDVCNCAFKLATSTVWPGPDEFKKALDELPEFRSPRCDRRGRLLVYAFDFLDIEADLSDFVLDIKVEKVFPAGRGRVQSAP